MNTIGPWRPRIRKVRGYLCEGGYCACGNCKGGAEAENAGGETKAGDGLLEPSRCDISVGDILIWWLIQVENLEKVGTCDL